MTTKASTNPRFLLVTRNFPPLTGGMERLMQNAAQGISSYAELTIVGPRGCGAHAPSGVTVIEVPPSLVPFLIMGSLCALRACLRQKFDAVIGGSGLAAPTLLLLKKLFKVPTVVFVHGLDIVVSNVVYQKLFVSAVTATDLIIANSQNTKRLAIGRGAPANQITVINPGTELTGAGYIPEPDAFKSEHGLSGKNIILFTGRITRRKGLSAFIRLCLPLVVRSAANTVLLVVGDSPEQSLNRQSEAEDVAAAVAESALLQSVVFLGKVSDEDLMRAYAAADVQILPLVDTPGDVEGFGMVAIEAAALGTPTVAFDLGGVADAVSPRNGFLVAAGRYDLFAESLTTCLRNPSPDSNSCREHAKGFSWGHFNKRVKTALASTLPHLRLQ